MQVECIQPWLHGHLGEDAANSLAGGKSGVHAANRTDEQLLLWKLAASSLGMRSNSFGMHHDEAVPQVYPGERQSTVLTLSVLSVGVESAAWLWEGVMGVIMQMQPIVQQAP